MEILYQVHKNIYIYIHTQMWRYCIRYMRIYIYIHTHYIYIQIWKYCIRYIRIYIYIYIHTHKCGDTASGT